MTHPDHEDHGVDAINEIIEQLSVSISGEILGEPGGYGYWLGNYYPIQVAEGKVTGVGGTIMEITRFKQAYNPKLRRLTMW